MDKNENEIEDMRRKVNSERLISPLHMISLATFAAAAAGDFNLIRPTHLASKSPMDNRTKKSRMRSKMAKESRRRNR